MLSKTLLRAEQNQEHLWNLSPLFKDEAAFKKDLDFFLNQTSSERWKSILEYKGTLAQSPQKVKEVLSLLLEKDRHLTRLYTYAHLKHDEDLSNQTWNQFFQSITLVYQDFFQNISWLEPELLAFSEEAFETLFKEPDLKEYEFYLQNLQHKKEFTLSSDKEELLSLASLPLNSTQKAFNLFNNVDLKLGEVLDSEQKSHPLTHGNYRVYLRSQDRTLRKNAFIGLHQKFSEFENTLSELLMGHVQKHVFVTKSRGYSSSLMASLYPKNIPCKTYHNLIQTVKKYAPYLHDYVKTRKEIMGEESFHLYDLQIPFFKHSEATIPYEQAVEWVIESVAPLGEEYQSILRKGLTVDGWVDVYENQFKRSGAYSSGCYDSHPYILMNYKGTLNDVFTLAHEAGHSMHSYYSNKNQPYAYARYPIFVAEVASVFNETLLMDYLLKKLESKEEQWALLHERLEEVRNTLYRQTLFAEFELFLHETLESSKPLTAQMINEKYLALNKEYYGPSLDYDDEIAIEWARVPHFYSNFYVYQYATGISAALTLAYRVLDQEKGAKEAYLNFLSQGGHQYPIDLLKTAGVDMETSHPIERALQIFKEHVDKLKEIKKFSNT